MGGDKLVSYIKDMIDRGYDINQIKDQLYKAGYSPQVVEQSCQKAYTINVKHTIHFSKATIIALVIILIAIAGIFALLQKEDDKPARLMDLKVNVITPIIEPGKKLQFQTNMINFGSDKIYDIFLKYELIEISTSDVIAYEEETKALETTASSTFEMTMPEDAPLGNYILRATADYENSKAIASSRFKVVEASGATAETPVKEQPITCDDNNDCTTDDIVEGECIHTAITPCCGNFICESGEKQSCEDDCKDSMGPVETVNRAKSIAVTDPQKALQLCDTLSGFNKDSCLSNIASSAKDPNLCSRINQKTSEHSCYRTLASEANDPSICERITANQIRDVCFAEFVTKGDYTVCEEFSSDYFKETCENLRDNTALISK